MPASASGTRLAIAGAVALAGLLAPAGARAEDTLDAVRRRGAIRWGGDQEGGGPYVFPRDDDPSRVTGFEVDLADRIAADLGVRAEFSQGAWDKLGDLLGTRKIDVVLNGYEVTPELLATHRPTMPYYVYALQLLAPARDATIGSWDDLGRGVAGRPTRVGVLTGSAAERVARERCPGCAIVSYDGNTDAMREVETGKLDATVQDTPIASFYAPRFPGLRAVGEPVARGYYVGYVRRADARLGRAVDEALVRAIVDGEHERILRRYGIWNEDQRELRRLVEAGSFQGRPIPRPPDAALPAPGSPPPAEEPAVRLGERKRGLDVVRAYGGILLRSAGLTVLLSVTSFPIAVALGLLVALGRVYGPAWLRWPLAAYVEFLRGTPVMLQLYFVFFLLPEIGVDIPALETGILGLAINYSAYEAEIYRAGLQGVPSGQLEAALSLGMSRWQAVRHVIVPQAVRLVVPPVVNDFIALFKDTSVCSVITLVELTKRFSVLSMSTQATVELMALTALLYLAMSFPMSLVARRLERRLGVGVAA